MKTPIRQIFLILVITTLITIQVQAQDNDNSPILRLLQFIPDIPLDPTSRPARIYVYGDVAAWHSSWNIPRVVSYEALAALGEHARNYWLNILPKQAFPPNVLPTPYDDSQQRFYGFDLFSVDRYIYAEGMGINVVEYGSGLNQAKVDAALITSGYNLQFPEGSYDRFFSLLKDRESAPRDSSIPLVGRDGGLNRIASLVSGQLIISSSTDRVMAAIETKAGKYQSLADNRTFQSMVRALADPLIADTGELTGVIFVEAEPLVGWGARLAIPITLAPSQRPKTLEEIIEHYPPLPPYLLVAFATRHTKGATSQILAVVFPNGTDIALAAQSLQDRLLAYESQLYHRNLLEIQGMRIDRTLTIEAEGLPVVMVILRSDDPPLEYPKGAIAAPNSVPTHVPNWMDVVNKLEYGFLAVTTP